MHKLVFSWEQGPGIYRWTLWIHTHSEWGRTYCNGGDYCVSKPVNDRDGSCDFICNVDPVR